MLRLAIILAGCAISVAAGAAPFAPPANTSSHDNSSRLCSGGDGEACNRIGVAYHAGRPPARGQNLPMAQTFYEMACNARYGPGCQNLGDLQAQIGYSLPTSREAWRRAADIYRAACDKGAFHYCVNLGTLHEDGKLVPSEMTTAAALYNRACTGGDVGGCVNLASLYLDGRGVAKNEHKGKSLLDRACRPLGKARGERGRQEAVGACSNLASVLEPTDPKRAVDLHRKACDAGSMMACSNLGILLSQGRGVKAADWKSANALFRKACDGGDSAGCWNLALSLDAGSGGEAPDAAGAKELRDRACEMGLAKACR